MNSIEPMNGLEPIDRSRRDHEGAPGGSKEELEPPSKGPSLVLLYSLIALALAAAIGFAYVILLPFANRR